MSKIKEDILEHLFYDEYIQEQLQNEEMRAEEIEELEDYVGTKEYIEDVAKDKLGLVHPNEILFEAE